MGWLDRFKKKQEVLDLVNLKKRGLVKDEDLGIEESAIGLSSTKSQQPSDNPLGFLASLAGSTEESNQDSNNTGTVDLGVATSRKKILREKIRDMENRLDSLSSQLQKAVDRLELLERKLERKGI